MIIAWIIAETTGIVDVVLGFFSRGGLFMWPLLICSIVSVTIMILRGLALRRKIVLPAAIESEIERMTPGECCHARTIHERPPLLANGSGLQTTGRAGNWLRDQPWRRRRDGRSRDRNVGIFRRQLRKLQLIAR